MTIIRSWREQKVLLKRKFPFLTDGDFAFEIGKEKSMRSELAIKLEKTDFEMKMLFSELQKL